jgi:hypothetical protein
MVNGIIIMNNNISANENYNKHQYTNIDQQYYNAFTAYIKQRRAEIVYQYELQQAKQRAEAQAQSDLVSWAETRD